MQIKTLKVFCDVVGLRSFSRAANKYGISQSGASQAVHHLEKELGVKLIDRSKRPFVLTPEGNEFYGGALSLVEQYDAVCERVRTLHQDVEGQVTVAAIYSVGLSYLNELERRFLEEHPRAQAHIQYELPNRVYELVENDQVDLGLVSYPKSSRTIDVAPWRNEEMVVVCAPSHPLAKRQAVSLSDLAEVAMIGFDRDLTIRRELDRAFSAAGVKPKYTKQLDNIEVIKRAIEINGSVGLLPRPTVQREAKTGALKVIPIEGVKLERPIGILTRHGRPLGPTAEKFRELLCQSH